MNYYKVIKNGTVVDANFVFLKWQPKNRILIGCDASEANFIQSSDQNEVWRVDWLVPYSEEAGVYETVEAVEITEEEYLELRALLDEGTEVVVPEEPEAEPEEEETESEGTGETVMTVPQMRLKVATLEEQLEQQLLINAEQMARNEFLEACLLEMSEIVYG